MSNTSNAPLTTGLLGAWFCSAFALVTGTLWLQFSQEGRGTGFYDPNMLGYLLVLTGLLPIGPLAASTIGVRYGHHDLAQRTARVVKCAIPTSIFLGWLFSSLLGLASSSGMI